MPDEVEEIEEKEEKPKAPEKGKAGSKSKAPPVPKKQVPAFPFEKVLWAGVLDVYQCVECQECGDTIDEIITHCLSHYPKKEQEKMLDIMLAKEL